MAIVVGPIVASFVIAALLSHLLPRASSPLTAVLWIAIVGGSSLLTLVVFERAARRLLPLAALLNVSLLFPDKAPARFAVARRTGSPSHLRDQLAQARAAGHQDDVKGMQTVIELVLALSVHDKATRGHSERVRVYTDMLADELKIDEGEKARLRWAALLHDIGKLEISPTLLNKPGTPTAEEWEVLHRHPEDGARLVAPMLAWLGELGRAVAEHHERWDGLGYPHGLRGAEISLAARIVAVADVYEVMTSPRPYKASMSVADARLELNSCCRHPARSSHRSRIPQHLDRAPLAHCWHCRVDRPDSQPCAPLAGTRQHRHLGGDGCAERRHRDRPHRWRPWTADTLTRWTHRPWSPFELAWPHFLGTTLNLGGSDHGAGYVRAPRGNILHDPAAPFDVSANAESHSDVQAEPDADADSDTDPDPDTATAVALPPVPQQLTQM